MPAGEALRRYSLFAALRAVEQACPERPRLGESARPADDAIRLGQKAHLSFVPTELAGLETPDGGAPRLDQYGFGLLGPNGPLPIHITEIVFQRQRHANDPTLADFLNLLQQRFIAFFYRAWADSDPCTNRDRPAQDRFRGYVGALIGLHVGRRWPQDDVLDDAKLGRAGLFGCLPRSADGLEAILADHFELPIRIRQFVPGWLAIPEDARSRLGGDPAAATLGDGAVLGAATWQAQHQFEVIVGPLDVDEFESFLPGGEALAELQALIRFYTNGEWAWRLRLELRETETRRSRLNVATRLGWNSWLGERDGILDDVWIRGDRLEAPVHAPRSMGDG